MGARGAKVRVPGHTGGEQGLKGCGANSLEGRGGPGGPVGRGQAPTNVLYACYPPIPGRELLELTNRIAGRETSI